MKIKRKQYEHFLNLRIHCQVIFSSFTASHVDIIYNIYYVFLLLWGILEGHRLKQRPARTNLLPFHMYYSGIFYFCQNLHIGAGILSFGGDVFRL